MTPALSLLALYALAAPAAALVAIEPQPSSGFGAWQVTLELRLHLSPGRRPFGLSAGLGLDWLLTEDYNGPVIGPHVEARWSRLDYGAFSLFGRAGYCVAWDNYNGRFVPGFMGALESGWTWRTEHGPGLRVGGIFQIPYVSLAYDQLIDLGGFTGSPRPAPLEIDPDADPYAPLPVARWRRTPLSDPTISFSAELPVIGVY